MVIIVRVQLVVINTKTLEKVVSLVFSLSLRAFKNFPIVNTDHHSLTLHV